MPVNPVQALASPEASDRSTAPKSGELGQQAFMQLLVAEMRHQDPLDPMQAREIVTQLSQLSSVEKLSAIEQRLGMLEIASAGIANAQATDLVGRTVRADGDHLTLGATGPAETHYTVQSPAHEVTVVVRDAAGRTVRTLHQGETGPGPQTVSWDGNDDTGERLEPGSYRVEITATDASGNPVAVSTELSGRVDGVSYEHGYPELIVGPARVMLGDVVSISG